jgi:hypothetical protein
MQFLCMACRRGFDHLPRVSSEASRRYALRFVSFLRSAALLAADHLRWFDDKSVTIEDIMREKGIPVTKAVGDGKGGSTLSISPEDLQHMANAPSRAGARAGAGAGSSAASGQQSQVQAPPAVVGESEKPKS